MPRTLNNGPHSTGLIDHSRCAVEPLPLNGLPDRRAPPDRLQQCRSTASAVSLPISTVEHSGEGTAPPLPLPTHIATNQAELPECAASTWQHLPPHSQ
jgi:hypothetical protein